VHAEVIRPDDQGKDALPKSEVKVPDSEEPRYKPHSTRHRVVFYLYLIHDPIIPRHGASSDGNQNPRKTSRPSIPAAELGAFRGAATVVFFWIRYAHRAHFLHGTIHPHASD